MEKYYRVKKDTFMWDAGAVLKHSDSYTGGGYKEMDDLFNRISLKGEYITAHIIENPANADFFERVYPVNLVSKTIYKLREEAKALLAKEYKAD